MHLCLEDRQLQSEETMFPTVLNCTHLSFTGNLLPAQIPLQHCSCLTWLSNSLCLHPSSMTHSERQPQEWALEGCCVFTCIHSQTAASRDATGGLSLLTKYLCQRELHCSSVLWGTARRETNDTDKMFVVTRTFCHWHTNISTRFLPSPSAPWPDCPTILVLMLIFCAGWLICKSWPPPCGQTRKDQWMRGTSLQPVGSAQSSRRGGRWGAASSLAHPVHWRREAAAGWAETERWGASDTGGTAWDSTHPSQHKASALAREMQLRLTPPAWHYAFGLLPTGPSRDAAAGTTARAWAPHVRLFSWLDFCLWAQFCVGKNPLAKALQRHPNRHGGNYTVNYKYQKTQNIDPERQWASECDCPLTGLPLQEGHSFYLLE